MRCADWQGGTMSEGPPPRSVDSCAVVHTECIFADAEFGPGDEPNTWAKSLYLECTLGNCDGGSFCDRLVNIYHVQANFRIGRNSGGVEDENDVAGVRFGGKRRGAGGACVQARGYS